MHFHYLHIYVLSSFNLHIRFACNKGIFKYEAIFTVFNSVYNDQFNIDPCIYYKVIYSPSKNEFSW